MALKLLHTQEEKYQVCVSIHVCLCVCPYACVSRGGVEGAGLTIFYIKVSHSQRR